MLDYKEQQQQQQQHIGNAKNITSTMLIRVSLINIGNSPCSYRCGPLGGASKELLNQNERWQEQIPSTNQVFSRLIDQQINWSAV